MAPTRRLRRNITDHPRQSSISEAVIGGSPLARGVGADRCYQLPVSENAVQLGAYHAVGPTKGRKARSVPVPQFVLDELSI
jgi:hypothetical protein